MKLNLGFGNIPLKGYKNLDRKTGQEVYPLDFKDQSISEVRASHVLEHFNYTEIVGVLKEWVRVLKYGGSLKIAVPDFEWIAKNYLEGNDINVQGYTMGGQEDPNDFHKVIFDNNVLTELMRAAGLRNIRRWESNSTDCASLPVSLNLVGTKIKPIGIKEIHGMKVAAAMSVPRLGFMDNFFCSFSSLLPLKIPIRKHTGAFWGQCLERCIDEWIAEGREWILTIDYDTIFTRAHVEELLRLARDYPEADAIAPIQAGRSRESVLMTVRGTDGESKKEVARDDFEADLLPICTAHFGLTLLKVEKIKQMARPLFLGVPADDGTWGDGRTDDDIYFWRQWEAAGNTLFLANRVAVGHADMMILWPDNDLRPIYQHPSEFYDKGAPEEIWK